MEKELKVQSNDTKLNEMRQKMSIKRNHFDVRTKFLNPQKVVPEHDLHVVSYFFK